MNAIDVLTSATALVSSTTQNNATKHLHHYKQYSVSDVTLFSLHSF